MCKLATLIELKCGESLLFSKPLEENYEEDLLSEKTQ